mgnify:CR=1 FL=1
MTNLFQWNWAKWEERGKQEEVKAGQTLTKPKIQDGKMGKGIKIMIDLIKEGLNVALIATR